MTRHASSKIAMKLTNLDRNDSSAAADASTLVPSRARWLAVPLLVLATTASARAQTCTVTPSNCCAGRPLFTNPAYSTFGNLVSVGTASPQAANASVVAVFDLGSPNAGPFDTDLGAPIYTDPSWSEGNLGSVFGVTLDIQGNIYVASTTCYSSDTLGTLGGSGVVYKLDTFTSAASVFCTLPNTGPELGNLCYDCTFDQFFVSNMDDGKIYRVTSTGAIASTFDFGAPDVPLPVGTFAPLGERIWAVQVHGGRLYFSVWNEDFGNPSPTAANEIWSIGLSGLGDFSGAPVLEISIPPIAGVYSNPVSDMCFTASGSLFLAERGMVNATTPTPHDSRLLEYVCAGGVWVPSGNSFGVGVIGAGENTAGGVDVNDGPCGRVYATGDALQTAPQVVYGTQGLPIGGGSTASSVLVDYNANLTVFDKTFIGDVAIPCVAADPCVPTEPGSLSCAGDGTGSPCPCGNFSAFGSGEGCLNSLGTGGKLTGTGVAFSEYAACPSVAPAGTDTVTLVVTGIPNTATLLYRGTTQLNGGSGVIFGDGLRCCGGVSSRVGIKFGVGHSVSFGFPLEKLSVTSQSCAGVTYCYQAWYRDSAAFCTSAMFNLSNGYTIAWRP